MHWLAIFTAFRVACESPGVPRVFRSGQKHIYHGENNVYCYVRGEEKDPPLPGRIGFPHSLKAWLGTQIPGGCGGEEVRE